MVGMSLAALACFAVACLLRQSPRGDGAAADANDSSGITFTSAHTEGAWTPAWAIPHTLPR
eukprot:14218913-Alexandrium_andersonii.AAC.1